MESSYEAILSQCFSTLNDELSSPDWKSITKTDSYELFTKFGGDCFKTVKVTGIFPSDPLKVKDFLFNPANITKYDDTKESRSELESGANYKVFLTKGAANVFMMDPRDTVIVLGFKVEKESVIIAGKSVEHNKAPMEEGRVRANCGIVGYVLEMIPGEEKKCSFTFVGRVDPRTRMPGSIVSKMVQKEGEVIMNLIKCLGEI